MQRALARIACLALTAAVFACGGGSDSGGAAGQPSEPTVGGDAVETPLPQANGTAESVATGVPTGIPTPEATPTAPSTAVPTATAEPTVTPTPTEDSAGQVTP